MKIAYLIDSTNTTLVDSDMEINNVWKEFDLGLISFNNYAFSCKKEKCCMKYLKKGKNCKKCPKI